MRRRNYEAMKRGDDGTGRRGNEKAVRRRNGETENPNFALSTLNFSLRTLHIAPSNFSLRTMQFAP